MKNVIDGANIMLKGLKYHGDHFLILQKQLDALDNRAHDYLPTIEKMNHEAIAYFNRMGQFYYLAKSDKVAEIVADYKSHIPNVLRLLIYRMKQSAHRATDAPRGEDSYNMEQLDNRFTWGSLTINGKICYQILLDEPDPITHKSSVNFFMGEDHPKLVKEIEDFIQLLGT